MKEFPQDFSVIQIFLQVLKIHAYQKVSSRYVFHLATPALEWPRPHCMKDVQERTCLSTKAGHQSAISLSGFRQTAWYTKNCQKCKGRVHKSFMDPKEVTTNHLQNNSIKYHNKLPSQVLKQSLSI